MNENHLLNRTLIALGASSIVGLLFINKGKPTKHPKLKLTKQPYQLARLFEQKLTRAFNSSSQGLLFIHDCAAQIEQLIDQVELKLK